MQQPNPTPPPTAAIIIGIGMVADFATIGTAFAIIGLPKMIASPRTLLRLLEE